jgi:hypothetical protein
MGMDVNLALVYQALARVVDIALHLPTITITLLIAIVFMFM